MVDSEQLKQSCTDAFADADVDHDKVGPGGYCSPHHSTHFQPSSLDLSGKI
jgi:hypothetical protein